MKATYKMVENQQLYTAKQIAEFLQVSTTAVTKWRRRGKLWPVEARSRYYAESELFRFLGLDSHGEPCANQYRDENGNARGELAVAQAEANLNAE